MYGQTAALHYWSFEGKKTMNLHNDAVLANIMVKLCKGAFLAGEAV